VSEEAANLVTVAVSGAFIEGIHMPAFGAGIYRGGGNPKFVLFNLALPLNATPRCRHMRHGERSFAACRLGQASRF
jgi:hypothetical protein